MLSSILFDLDGTLTDPKVGITKCIQYSLEQLSVPPPEMEQLTWCIGPPLRESFARLLKTTDDGLIEQALSFYRIRFSKTGMFENYVYQDVRHSLKRLRASGGNIFLATSKPRVFAKKILEHFKLIHYFSGVYGSELNGLLSDKGELIAHILDVESLDPGKTIMVGDRSYDVIGGKSNAIMTAAVSYGYGSMQEIISSKPDGIFDTFTALTDFIVSRIL